MSLARKSHEPIVVVSVNDPAIDRHTIKGQVALKRYAKERDPSVLLFLDGATPTRFVLRPLRNMARTWIESMPGEAPGRHLLAFCAAIDHVDDETLAWVKAERPAAWGPDATTVTMESASELADMVGGKVLEEVGAVALQRANLTADQKKAYWLPPGCEVDWRIGSDATRPLPTSEPESESS